MHSYSRIRTNEDGSRDLLVLSSYGFITATAAIKMRIPIFGHVFTSLSSLQQHLVSLELETEPSNVIIHKT